MSGFFRKTAQRLVANGYGVVPIARGSKAPALDNWQEDFARTQAQVAAITTERPNDGVGIVTKYNPAVDIDCYDNDIVEAMVTWCHDNLGDAPLRIGKSPKALLLYVTDSPFSKVTSARYFDPKHPELDPVGKNGKRKGQRVEILGDGQQFVAYHIHPDTGKPYTWPNDFSNPLDIPSIDLDVIGVEHARAACREFERLCEENGWERLGDGSASDSRGTFDEDDALSEVEAPDETEEEVERVRSALKAISDDVASGYDYDTWRNVMFALKWTRWDCAESLAREWSESSDKHVTREFNVVWRGAQKRDRGREITLGSMFKLAKDAGWDSSRLPTDEERAETFASIMETVGTLKTVDNTRKVVQDIIKKLGEVSLTSASEGQILKAIKQATGDSIADLRRDLAKARKEHAKEESFMATHAGYAGNLIERLEQKGGVNPVGVESMIYTFSESRGVWKGTLIPDFSVQVAKLFDGQENCSRRNDYLAIAQHAYSVISDGKETFFQDAPVGLACKGRFYSVNKKGVIEKEELDHTHRQRVLSPVQPKFGDTPKFDAFLQQTFKGDPDDEQILLLQEVMGSIILGLMARYEKVVLMKGLGRSGKGTIMKIIESMLPSDVRSAVSPFRWDGEYYLANLSGKRLNVVGELPDDIPIPSAEFKSVTGRDTLTGRHPTHRPFTFRNEAAHVFNTNHFVYTKDHSEAFYSRWLLLEFRNSLIGREDEQIVTLADDIIAEELPAIMAWALQGAKRLEDRGFFPTTKIQLKMMAQWRHRTSTLIEFLLDREVCRLGDGRVTSTKRTEFYRAYTEWCKDSNRRPMGKMKLYDELDGYGVQQLGVKQGTDAKGNDVIRGIVVGNENWVVVEDDEL
jgi:P4 family phage/plasmid primase-like protien